VESQSEEPENGTVTEWWTTQKTVRVNNFPTWGPRQSTPVYQVFKTFYEIKFLKIMSNQMKVEMFSTVMQLI
jgi:hypothetical protein